MTGVLITGEMDTDTQTHTDVEGRRPCDAGGIDGSNAAAGQGTPRAAFNTGSQEEETRIFLEP